MELHPDGEIAVWHLDEKMEVIRHEAVREQRPPPLADNLSEKREMVEAVELIDLDPSSVVTARSYVIDAARLDKSGWAWHLPTVATR